CVSGNGLPEFVGYAEIRGVRFDLLKCLDLYHSDELDNQVERLVIDPMRTYPQDSPSSAQP
ncbi:T6SS amidase immunity protein Tai4 family protein, partial [Priestia megaterium]|uniref:T6SS amidase immunity protein Tai4 family protein n=1 Tax=Priestia megaterium TaxID=1404 RepID=UPI001C5526CB